MTPFYLSSFLLMSNRNLFLFHLLLALARKNGRTPTFTHCNFVSILLSFCIPYGKSVDAVTSSAAIRLRRRAVILLAFLLERQRTRSRWIRRALKRAWIWPRNQYLFENMLAGNLPEQKWRENFRVSRDTFLKIVDLVRPEPEWIF